ncbi:MAG: hypothetical protein E6K70_12350 [Planctomycetota bacterium]|nr:MAG: hypothetical protein E6K70_12350 [Planctomycetota bacterium]
MPNQRGFVGLQQVDSTMAMVCPQCNQAFEQRLNCPQCGVRLLYQFTRRADKLALVGPDATWQQTPWGRICVGLLLAQGVYYVLRHLFTAGLLAASSEATGVWATLSGLVLVQVLQAVGVLLAGMLSGAGQRRGILLGTLVGIWNGVFFVVVQACVGQTSTPIDLFGEPMLQAAFGAVGGFIGSQIWKPLPSVSLPFEMRGAKAITPPVKRRSYFAGPIAWTRVLTGIALTVGGVMWANIIRDLVIEASEGKLSIDSQLQADLVTFEVSALAMIAGSGFAGANTFNGLKQGLCVGLGSGAVLFGLRLGTGNFSPEILILTLVTAIGFGVAGGWFGGELFPPLLAAGERKRRRPAYV